MDNRIFLPKNQEEFLGILTISGMNKSSYSYKSPSKTKKSSRLPDARLSKKQSRPKKLLFIGTARRVFGKKLDGAPPRVIEKGGV
ncbi:MAG: hypothetical protein IJI37_04615 [Opitutales bacterium]|nr:hypothetical protein [Opitutales bacterium]